MDDDPKALLRAGRPFGLTFKELEFCSEYLKCGKASTAALAAGYSEKYANNAHRLLRKPTVAAFLKEQVSKRFDEERMENGEILARLARLARLDPRKIFNEDGSHKLPHEMDEATAACVRAFETELSFTEDGAPPVATRKVKLADPLPALRTLAQVNQLLTQDTKQINVFIDLDARMDAARKRLSNQRDEKVVSEQ
jgi:phage terminase small subunit